MTSHSLNPLEKVQISCHTSILRQFASLLLVAALFAATLALGGTLQRVRKNSYVRQGAVLDHSKVSSAARESPGTLARMSQDQQRRDSAPLETGAFASNGIFSANSPSQITGTTAQSLCSLYPIALNSNSLSGVAAGGLIADILNGTQPGNFGWLSWTGSSSEPALVASLTPPGNSSSYINPDKSSDHEISVGDWIQGKPGVSNSRSVREALDVLKSIDITVPVWNSAQEQGSKTIYRVSAFARVRLLSYQLPGQNRISARFLGYTQCPLPINRPPTVNAGPNQTITLPSVAHLNGTVSDDGLPAGGTLTTLWSQVSGPGLATFANTSVTVTTVAFSVAGTYVLRLSGNDSKLTSSDDITIVVSRPANQPPMVNAGPDQVIKLPATASLNGTVTDDGQPRGGTLTILWTKVSGPGNVIFSNANRATTTAAFSMAGTYVLRLTASDSQLSRSDDVNVIVNPANQPPMVSAGPDQTVTLPSRPPVPQTLTLRAISTGFNSPIGIDYHQPTNKVVMSVNYPSGQPSNFELVAADGTRTPFSNISSLTDELKLATARDDGGNGMSIGGFKAGELFTGSGVPGVIVRVSNDGSLVQNPWVTLPGETGLMRGSLYVDRTGVFGGDLIAVTTTGGVWRINSSGQPTQLTRLGTHLEGLSTIPNDPVRYGPWAGKILVGAEDQGFLYTVDAQGHIAFYQLGINPEDIDIIPANENFFGVGFSEQTLWGAPAAAFAGMVGDILIAQEFPGILYRVHWNGSAFEKTQLAQVSQWEHVTFAPAGISEIPPVGVTVNLNGSVTDDTAPGFPLSVSWTEVSGPAPVSFANPNQTAATATFTEPGTYVLRLTANDTEFMAIDEVTITVNPGNQAPAVNAGSDQTVTLPNTATLNGTVNDDGLPAGSVLVVSWSKVSGPGNVIFANAGAITTTASFSLPGAYVLRLTANDAQFSTSDDVIVTVNQANQPPVVNAGTDQTITLPNMAQLSGVVTDDGLPTGGSLTILWSQVSGSGSVTFGNASSPTTSATFSSSGTYVLRLTASDTQLSASDDVTINVVTNQAPNVDAGLRQTIKLPDAVNLDGTVSDDGIPTGATLIVIWSKVSGPGAVTFGNADLVDTNAAFGSLGYYVLRLTASDSLSSSHSDVTIKVLSADATPPGGVFVTGHDPDFHAAYNGPGASINPTGAKHIIQRSIAYVTSNKPNPRTLLVTDVRDPGSNEFLDSRLGLQAAGVPFDVADYGSSQQGALDLHTVNFSNYDVIVVASDFGGWLRQDELDILNARRSEIINYVNNGGGLVALAESGSHGSLTTQDRFGFLPFLVNQAALEHAESGNIVTAAGSALGLTNDDVNGNAFHNFFASTGGMDIIDVDPENRILSLALRGKSVTTGGFANDAPIVSARSDQTLTLPNNALTLNGIVSDDGEPQGSTLTIQWNKVSGPGSVTFSSPNQPTSNTTFSAPGTYVLQLLANDTQLTSSDTVVINVMSANQAPAVNAGADQTIALGNTATLSGTATDDDRPAGSTLSVSWTKVSGPGTVTFGNASQSATTATFSAGGRYVLRLTANDSQLTSSDDLAVTVNQAPVVNAGPDQTITLPSAATLNYTVSDDGLPVGNTTVTWSKVSGPGNVSFTSSGQSTVTASFSEAGSYVLRLSADDSHLTAADELTVTVNAAEPPPSVSIISPADESTVTTRADVIGSVSDGTWKLEYSLTADEGAPTQWTTFATGTGVVSNAPLGVFDPTLLLNGRYLIRLSATRGGQTASALVGVVVSEEQKVGNFTVTFSDLSVPVAGLPIEVTRTYDSRDKRQGDFGVGWTLGIRNVRLQESRAAGAQWQGDVSGPAQFPTYCINPSKPHVVTVTMANGRVYKFEAILSPGNGCQSLAPLQEVTLGFRPLPGTNASLIPLGENPLLVHGPFPGAIQLLDSNTVAPVDYDLYQLTLEDGTVLFINQATGLTQMIDTNGNSLTINAGGIIHSSGKSITFTRDAQGRITQITDPAGNSMTYAYDANGDLISFRDREGNVTSFTYNTTHGVLTINDPRGIQPLRNEYDAVGRLIRQVDAFGKEINFTHDLNAQQETVFDRLGHATVYDYDARGNVVRVQDAGGNITTRTYDPRDNLLSETNALGKTSTFTYNAQDNRLSETDALNNTTSYTYNSRRQVLTATDPADGVTIYTYDANGNQTAVKDALGHMTGATFSANGLQLTSTDALNNTTSFEYDASGNLIKQTDPLGNVTTYTYDANGNRLSQLETRTVSGATETLTTTFEYDKLGRQTKVTYPDGSTTETIFNSIGKQSVTIDQLSRRTSYDYDDMGQLIRTTHPDNTQEQAEYDFEGRRTKSIDRAGRATVYVYDSLGRLERITFPDSSTTLSTYDAIGQVTTTTDALGHITRYEYDAVGHRTKVIDALNNETVFGYDTRGNQTSVKDAKGNISSYVYDANNRRTQVVVPDGATQTTVYDNLGQVKVKTDQAGVATSYDYDKRGKLTKVTDALGSVTSYTYDEQGNQLTQTDANNHTTAYGYDQMGRRIRRTLPLGMSETYAYDLAGNLSSRTDFRGRTTTFAYDAMNRLLSKAPDASLGEAPVTFVYTATGRRQTMADASGTTRYIYDLRDRLANKETPQGVLNYTYDGASNLKSVRSLNANGVTVDYNYDALNRLSNVTDNRLLGTTAYTYDPNGNLETTTYPNAVRTSYTYNSLNRLTNVNAAKGVTLANYAYTLGAAGNRLSVTEVCSRRADYTYDALYRLKGEAISNDPVTTNNGSISYTYDAVGNRLNRASTVGAIAPTTSTFDVNDRLTSDSYDPNGNTTASNGNTYQYDFENRLTSLNGGPVRFIYDGDGNRVAKTVGGVTTRYLVDTNNHTGHAQVVEEITGSSVQRTYTYGHDLISQNQIIGGVWTPSFYGYDGQRSVRYLTNAFGAITDTYTYDAFGNLIARTGTTPNDYLYGGEQLDANLGFYYLRARFMNPSSGRFQTMDTFEGDVYDALTLHKYTYAGASPAIRNDPSGMFATLSDESAANSIRGTLIDIQINVGKNLQDLILYGGDVALRNLIEGTAKSIGTMLSVRMVGQVMRRAPFPQQQSPSTLIPNDLDAQELALANQVLAIRGGTLLGLKKTVDPEFSVLNLVPIIFKRVTSYRTLKNAVSDAQEKAQNANHHGAEVYIEASGLSARELLDSGSKDGLYVATMTGTISAINVLTSDGWVRIISTGKY